MPNDWDLLAANINQLNRQSDDLLRDALELEYEVRTGRRMPAWLGELQELADALERASGVDVEQHDLDVLDDLLGLQHRPRLALLQGGCETSPGDPAPLSAAEFREYLAWLATPEARSSTARWQPTRRQNRLLTSIPGGDHVA